MSLTKYAPIVGEVEAIQAPEDRTDDMAVGHAIAQLMTSGYVKGVSIADDASGLMVTFTGRVKSRGVKVAWGEWLAFIGEKAKVLTDDAFRSAYRDPNAI